MLHAVPKLRQWELLRLGGRRPQVAVRVDGCVWAVEEGRHVGVLLRLAEEVRVARGVLDINNVEAAITSLLSLSLVDITIIWPS